MGRLSRLAPTISSVPGCHTGGGVTKKAQKELEEFLASKPAWMQRVLQAVFSFSSREEELEWIANQDKVIEQQPEFERILRQIPAQWQAYRKRLKQQSQPMLRMMGMLPKGMPGRLPDSKAEKYFALHANDASYREIAKQELQAEPEGEAKKRRSRRRQSK
jgi:hypothetical protein